MSIQNLDQLTNRISNATDQLEVAVTAVRESAGVVESGTGESAQSARESAQSARESASSASIAQQSVVMADAHRQSAKAEASRASAYASQASSSADSSALSEGEARKSASTATAQVSLAKTEANKAKAEATTATTQAGVAKAEATKATTQANTATTQAGIASAKADQATQQATIATTQASLAKQAVLDAVKLEPSKDGLVEEAPKDNRIYGRVDGAWGLIPTGGGTSGGGTGAVDTVNGIAPDESGNVTVPIPQPTPQVKSDWNAISGVAEILNKPELFSGDYNDLTNKPEPVVPFSGDYNDLTNKPAPVVPFSGSYKDLKDKPAPTTPFSGNYYDLTNRPEIPVVVEQVNPDWNATSGKARILNKPVLFDGRWESLTGKPTIPTGTSNVTDNSQLTNGAGYIKDAPTDGKWYARKEGKWAEVETGKAFSGDYRDLTNKPVLNTDGSIGGNGFNGDYNDLVNKPPLITSNTQLFNGAGYIKDAVADNRQYVRKNHKWEVFDAKADVGYAVAFRDPNAIEGAEEWSGTRLYMSHTYTQDPNLLFTNWTIPNPHIPYPLYHLGLIGSDRSWKTDGELIQPEFFSHLPAGRYSFGADTFRRDYFPDGHILEGKVGYIEVIKITSRQAIPTLLNRGGLNLYTTGVAYVINDNNKIVSTYDFDEKTGEFIARVGDNSGVTPFSGRYADLSGKPTLFSGNYNDLANKPVLFSGDYNDLINVPPPSTTGGFSGNYKDLTNKPTKLSQFTNDLTMTATKVVNKRTGQAMEEWVGTQAQYDAIGTKDPNTRYWITEA